MNEPNQPKVSVQSASVPSPKTGAGVTGMSPENATDLPPCGCGSPDVIPECGKEDVFAQFKQEFVSCSDHLKFSIRGFSAKRMAYLLNAVQLWLLCMVNLETYYDAGAGICAVSLTLMVVNLLLGFLCPRGDKGRFLPFALSFFILVVTELTTPL